MSQRRLKSDVAETSRALHQKGWVANHDGNVSVRLQTNRFLCTPTSVSKASVTEAMLIVVDGQGAKVSGDLRPFSEMALHLAIYDARPDVAAVIHAHPPHATAFSVCGRGLDRPIIAESIVSLGDRVPLVPFAPPGTPGFTDGVRAAARHYDVLILENHGVISCGTDLEQAYLRMELVEHLAQIEAIALKLGGPQYLGTEVIAPLLEKRAKAGLGPRARGISEASGSTIRTTNSADTEALRRIVAEEIRALLGGS